MKRQNPWNKLADPTKKQFVAELEEFLTAKLEQESETSDSGTSDGPQVKENPSAKNVRKAVAHSTTTASSPQEPVKKSNRSRNANQSQPRSKEVDSLASVTNPGAKDLVSSKSDSERKPKNDSNDNEIRDIFSLEIQELILQLEEANQKDVVKSIGTSKEQGKPKNTDNSQNTAPHFVAVGDELIDQEPKHFTELRSVTSDALGSTVTALNCLTTPYLSSYAEVEPRSTIAYEPNQSTVPNASLLKGNCLKTLYQPLYIDVGPQRSISVESNQFGERNSVLPRAYPTSNYPAHEPHLPNPANPYQYSTLNPSPSWASKAQSSVTTAPQGFLESISTHGLGAEQSFPGGRKPTLSASSNSSQCPAVTVINCYSTSTYPHNTGTELSCTTSAPNVGSTQDYNHCEISTSMYNTAPTAPNQTASSSSHIHRAQLSASATKLMPPGPNYSMPSNPIHSQTQKSQSSTTSVRHGIATPDSLSIRPINPNTTFYTVNSARPNLYYNNNWGAPSNPPLHSRASALPSNPPRYDGVRGPNIGVYGTPGYPVMSENPYVHSHRMKSLPSMNAHSCDYLRETCMIQRDTINQSNITNSCLVSNYEALTKSYKRLFESVQKLEEKTELLVKSRIQDHWTMKRCLEKLDVLIRILDPKGITQEHSVLKKKYSFLPLQTMDDLKRFEKTLESPSELDEFSRFLETLAGDDPRQTIRNCLRKTITLSVAIEYSYGGKSKTNFSLLRINKAITDATMSVHDNATDSDIGKTIAMFLSNSRVSALREIKYGSESILKSTLSKPLSKEETTSGVAHEPSTATASTDVTLTESDLKIPDPADLLDQSSFGSEEFLREFGLAPIFESGDIFTQGSSQIASNSSNLPQ